MVFVGPVLLNRLLNFLSNEKEGEQEGTFTVNKNYRFCLGTGSPTVFSNFSAMNFYEKTIEMFQFPQDLFGFFLTNWYAGQSILWISLGLRISYFFYHSNAPLERTVEQHYLDGHAHAASNCDDVILQSNENVDYSETRNGNRENC